MTRCWIVIDVNNLAHQVAHRGGKVHLEDMDPDEIKETLIGDMLQEYILRRRTLSAKQVVWCFDGSALKLIRKKILAGYKSTRQEKEKTLTPHEAAVIGEIRYQCLRMRKGALPAAGFRNILHAEGYEGDDHVAAAVRTIVSTSISDEVVIVSSDKDLLQCLGPRVFIHKPEGLFGLDDFRAKYGIEPNQWQMVKAMSGCVTDDVPGVEGVGEKTALKFIRKELPPHHKIYQKIVAASVDLIPNNMKLVRLPMDGCPKAVLSVEDTITQESWARVCRKLGATHLIRQAPVSRRV